MKIFRLFFAFVFLLSVLGLNVPKTTFASNTFFAQVPKGASVYFFSAPQKSDENVLFVLPSTYFVELLKNANEDFYYARYNDIYGYVLKSDVKPVKNTPMVPFATNVNFRIFVPSGANLRSTPHNNGSLNLVYSIPFLDNNLLYYGVAFGDEAISRKGNVWYYCKYYTGNLTYTGYVYSPLCDELATLPENTETVEFLDNISFEDEVTSTSGDVFKGLSSTTTTIIIIFVSLPCLLLIYLLFKPTRLAEQSQQHTPSRKRDKRKIKRLKNSDYFELDDDF